MAATDKQKANLKPAQKGEVRNPNGRPKKVPALDELLANVLGDEQNGLTAAEAILKALRGKAIKGDVRAAEVLLDRAYGKAKQEIKHDLDTGIEGFKIEVKRNRDDT